MKLYLKTKDYSISGEEFQLCHNEELDMLVTQPVPENLEKYYDSKDYISHTDSKRTVFDSLYQSVKRKNLKNKIQLIENQIVNKENLVDIGAGTGDFLVVAKSCGFRVEGVEPNSKAREKATGKGINLKEGLESLDNEKYQVITLWHVLEHLPDLDTHAKKLSALLKPDGVLIIAVPNFKSWDAKHYKSYWAAFDVPRHLSHFSRKSISKIFAKHGLVVDQIRPMIFDAFYVSILSEKYKGNKMHFVAGMIKGLWSNLKALYTKEYSSLIYILKKEV
nr:class I SAM-dependent methyltransferase [Allomuricauda sp.]